MSLPPEQTAEDWNIPDEPLTAERAALMAAAALDMAADASHVPEHSAALVAVADGWTRLHTALANAPKEIEPEHVSEHGGEFGLRVVRTDTANGTRWQVDSHGLWVVADEDGFHKAIARLRVLKQEIADAIGMLKALGSYQGRLPLADAPPGAAIVACPVSGRCAWHTYWDSEEEAAEASRRHVAEDHNGA